MSISNGNRESLINYVDNDSNRNLLRSKISRDESGVLVIFKKKDGTKRALICTTNPISIPENKMPKGNGKVSENKDVMRVFDKVLGEWRSFRFDSVISAW